MFRESALSCTPLNHHMELRLGRVVRLTLQGAEVLGSNPPPCGLVRSLTSQFVFSTRVSISSHSCLPQRSKEICVRAFARLKWGLCAFYALEVVFPLRTAPLQRALLVILYHHKRPAYRYALDTFPLPTEFTTPFGARKMSWARSLGCGTAICSCHGVPEPRYYGL